MVGARQDSEKKGSLFNRGTQGTIFEKCEDCLLSAVARRRQVKSKEMFAFDTFNTVQDHLLHAANEHTDRVVLETFLAGIESCNDPAARKLLDIVCDLYALSVKARHGTSSIDTSPPSALKAIAKGSRPMPSAAALCRDVGRRFSESQSSCVKPRCRTSRICPSELQPR